MPVSKGRALDDPPLATAAAPRTARYASGALTYANSFRSPLKRGIIRTIEWGTGKLKIIRMIRQFERLGTVPGPLFWSTALDVMGVKITTPSSQLAQIPRTGPVIFVANHPHGMVDGMVIAALIGQVRDDYKILTRSLLTQIDTTAANYLIPVPFPDHEDAQEQMVEMRASAMAHLKAGGVVALFPSGVIATSESLFGPVIEAEWNVFTAKLIRMSGATIVPCYFPGTNSRLYQMANRISPTLRQGLLLHEIVRSCNRQMAPVIGKAIPVHEVQQRITDPRSFMAWLRDTVLALQSSEFDPRV